MKNELDKRHTLMIVELGLQVAAASQPLHLHLYPPPPHPPHIVSFTGSIQGHKTLVEELVHYKLNVNV